jgi:hypothetical protein
VKPSVVLVAVWLGLSALHLGVSLRSDPGVYYDEVIQANPARDYLRGYARTKPPPQVTSIEVFGRPFPWKTQPYMGALKSQLLIPVFAAAGATPEVLRVTTTVWGLLAIGVAMLFANALLGLGPACALGALLAFDPTWLFVARHDWGSVSLALGLRMGALLLALRAWRTGGLGAALAAGAAAGLAVYNKVDAVPFLAGAAAGLAAARPDVVRSLVAERRRRALGLAAAAGAALGALPLIASADRILRASGTLSESSGLAVKARVALATLDGSYFHRLIEDHGSFATMLEGPSPSWALPWALAAGLVVLAVRSLRSGEDARLARFVVVSWAVTQAGLLAVPAADRVHHALNVYPLPHLAVVAAAAWAWRAAPGSGRTASGVARALLVVAGLALLGSGAWTIDRTADLIERTGGRGLWSDASTRLVHALDREGTTFVCLDWGFHQTLAFQTDHARVLDPVWRLRFARQEGRTWEMRGGAGYVYLVHDGPIDVTGFGAPFLAAVRALDPEQVEVRHWADREGGPALVSVRFRRPHDLLWRDGFEVRLR